MDVRHRGEALTEGRQQRLSLCQQAAPPIRSQMQQGAKEVEDRSDGGTPWVGGTELGNELLAVRWRAGGDDRAADGHQEVLVSRLNEGVESTVARSFSHRLSKEISAGSYVICSPSVCPVPPVHTWA